MNRREPPRVDGILAPHVPAEIYRDADGRILIVQSVAPRQTADWGRRFAVLGVVLAAGVGTTGLVLMVIAALDVAAQVAAGIATPMGVTVTVAFAARRKSPK
jgi:hypothetical protein